MADNRTAPDRPPTGFPHLDAGGRLFGALAARPKLPVLALVLVVSGLAWWFLARMAGAMAAVSGADALGPGMAFVSRFLPVAPDSLVARLADICLSSGMSVSGASGFSEALVLILMWFAMAAAMMLPTAAPMIRTYAEIADTAGAKGEPVVHVIVLVAGYLAVWALAAIGFAAVQITIARGSGAFASAPVSNGVAGIVLLCAGVYQFLPLKHACLEKCRNPFTMLFSRWKTTPAGVFRLGVDQGLYCLGCCWALMLVMLALGTMNIVWMAALTLFTFVEKSGTGPVTSRIGGVIVSLWGAALVAASVTA